MRVNTARDFSDVRTHEGAQAFPHLKPIDELRRSVLACLLWERGFYESGQTVADRISDLSQKVGKDDLAGLAIEARSEFNLRHVPLLLLVELARKGGAGVSDTIAKVIQRPDELVELLALYWRNGKTPISKQMRKGLAQAFGKFDRHRLAKYNRGDAIKLRDVMFLCRPKPKDAEQAETFKMVADNTLPTPDTWETNLSAGKDKAETFTRLLTEGNLGYLALLRNLRNMAESGVDEQLVRDAILARKGARRVLPFRYVAAARACPKFEPYLDQALCEAIKDMTPFAGKTVILVDVSGSMNQHLSFRSDLTRMDAAAALASIFPGEAQVFTFSAGNIKYWGDKWNGERVTVEVPPRKGMAGVDAVINSQAHGGTLLGQAVKEINQIPHDRLILITDEQTADRVPDPVCAKPYLINVDSGKNGVGYGAWTHIDGFSEAVIDYIKTRESETE